jgi:DNA polymerase-1
MQTTAATGRLSSKDPNLQNIPSRDEKSIPIRAAFIPSEKYHYLLSADYSQIEMRVMAHLSNDEGLIEAFNSGEDLHNYIASVVHNVAISDVSRQMRTQIKGVSYGLAYGLSTFGLSKQLKIPVHEAESISKKYFARFQGVRDYLNSVVGNAAAVGYTSTILGRRRYFQGLNSSNANIRQASERMALNAPIQGSAADIIKLAMISVNEGLSSANLKSRILLQIHDELIIETTEEEVDKAKDIIKSKAESVMSLKVPLIMSVGVGDNWQNALH